MQHSPHHTPTVGGIPDQSFPSSSLQVQLALSCRCPSRSKRPRPLGPHKRPLESGPPLGSLFPKMARGQLLAGHRGLGRQDRTVGDYPGLGKAGGHSMDARAHTSRARAAHAQGELPGPELQGGIPGLSGTRGSCHGPIALPTRAMPGRNATPGTTSPEDSTPAPHFFYPNRPPQSQSKRYPQMYPKLPLPFPVFIRSRHSRAPPLHPGPGSIQSRKTNRNSLTSLGRRLVLCYAGCGRSSMGSMSSIPGVDVACRALPDAR